MDINALIATILFILPGVLAYNWIEYVSNTTSRNKSNIEKTVMILCFAIPIVSLTLIILNTSLAYHIKGLSALTQAADDIKFLIYYFLISVIMAVFIGEFWVLCIRGLINKLVNFLRESSGLSSRQTISVWEEAFDHKKSKIAYIAQLSDPEKGQWGLLKTVSLSEERDREYILIGSDVIETIANTLDNPIKTYIDSKSLTIVKLYDVDQEKLQLEYHKSKQKIKKKT